MASLERSQRELNNVLGKEVQKEKQEKEFGPMQSKKIVEENKEKLKEEIERVRGSLGL
ncbi:MAG: hypothetical protein WC908_02230 [Candidatus Paceibacterota bacterium]